MLADMSRALEAAELATQLGTLPGWAGDTTGIRRTYQAQTFLEGIRLVDGVAEVAEEMDHHPDIDVRWRSVTFALVTHSEGGVTQLDIELAHRIGALADGLGAV
jgi:4a-hydroxytetrahydrobiopterin dehydratase